jgi:phosphate transport system substrate-binding protein
VLTDAAGKDSWPITGATFILMYKNPSDPAASASALKFFKWAYANGDDMAKALDYVPLPDNAVNSIQNSWKGIQGSGM